MAADFWTFFQNLTLHGLEYFKRYYGVYRGLVVRNDDPESRGRVQAHVPGVGQESAPDRWIDAAFAAAGFNRGGFYPPEVGDSVWVSFANGDPSRPEVYWGGWFGEGEVPSEFAPTSSTIGNESANIPERRGFITRKGHRVVFTDEDGKEAVEIAWHKPSSTEDVGTALEGAKKLGVVDPDAVPSYDRSAGDTHFIRMTEDGIRIENKEGTYIDILVEGKKVTIHAEQVEIAAGADTPAMRGDDWMRWATNHNHGTAWGPSSPPLTPPPQTILSAKVKVK